VVGAREGGGGGVGGSLSLGTTRLTSWASLIVIPTQLEPVCPAVHPKCNQAYLDANTAIQYNLKRVPRFCSIMVGQADGPT